MSSNILADFFSIEHYALKVRDDTTKDFDLKNKTQLSTIR
jgi:hypothetical protein